MSQAVVERLATLIVAQVVHVLEHLSGHYHATVISFASFLVTAVLTLLIRATVSQ